MVSESAECAKDRHKHRICQAKAKGDLEQCALNDHLLCMCRDRRPYFAGGDWLLHVGPQTAGSTKSCWRSLQCVIICILPCGITRVTRGPFWYMLNPCPQLPGPHGP